MTNKRPKNGFCPNDISVVRFGCTLSCPEAGMSKSLRAKGSHRGLMSRIGMVSDAPSTAEYFIYPPRYMVMR